MKSKITINQLKIFQDYGGDIDGFLRLGKKEDKNLFGSEMDVTWGQISNYLQNIELISKSLTSEKFKNDSLQEIRENCESDVYGELTKSITITSKCDLLNIIKDYQSAANKAVQIFKNKYQVEDILEGWHSNVYNQTGKLIEEGLYFYAFHGIGLIAHFKDKIVDFDFAYFPEPRHDGFDLWRLTNFIQNQRNKYPDYKDKEKIEREFNELIKNGVISKPKLENSTTLFFFSDTLKTEIIDETESKTTGNSTLPKAGRTWLQKLFDSE